MTEMMENTEATPIAWGGFAISLIAAPLVTFAPVFAALFALDAVYDSDDIRGAILMLYLTFLFGGVMHLVIGAPMLIWHLRRSRPTVRRIAALSVASLLWLAPVAAVLALVVGEAGPLLLFPFAGSIGLVRRPSLGDLLYSYLQTICLNLKDCLMHTLIAPPPPPYPVAYIIDPVAFFAALIGGPLLFTAASFWALFIPVAALFFGAPLYLMIGTPVLLWYLRSHDGDPSELGWLAFKVMAFAMLLITVIAAATQDEEILGVGLWFTGFGMIFAPAWAYFFGLIYRRLRRDFFAKPRNL